MIEDQHDKNLVDIIDQLNNGEKSLSKEEEIMSTAIPEQHLQPLDNTLEILPSDGIRPFDSESE